MAKMIQRIEDKVIRQYGFEAKRTIRIFRATEILRKVFRIKD